MAPAIEVKGLYKEFSLGFGVRKRMGLEGMTFTVEAGEVYGFLGPNGAGKTTSIKVLTSLLRADQGTATVFGESPDRPAARKRLGYLPESPVFYDHLTGREFMRFCGRISGVTEAVMRTRIDELLARVGLSHAADLQIRRYSKGMTQRVGIAQALIHDPDLVILDEPMSGLDPMGRAEVRDIIVSLKKQGKTIFFSTHIIPDVEVVCTRVGIVAKGRMLKEGSPSELLEQSTDTITEVALERLAPAFACPAGVEESVTAGARRMFLVEQQQLRPFLDQAFAAGGQLISVNQRRGSLEDHVVRLLAGAEKA